MNQNKIDEARWCMEGLIYDLNLDVTTLNEEILVYVAKKSLDCSCRSAADCNVEEYHKAVETFINENLRK